MNFSKKIYAIVLIVLSMLLSNLYAQSNPGKSIAADFSVSPTGALTYQVPFEVPSHVLGHFPDLGLTYNSQAGDGIAGYGWSISGLSSISRAPATSYHDGFIAAVDFTETDRFILDGQRLILKEGEYGKPGSTYETESYSNLKIEAIGNSKYGTGYGPSYFIVYHPNGLRYWYGYNDPTTYFGNSSSKLEWSISKIEDTKGNTVKFRYNNPGNNHVLRLDSVQDVTAKVTVKFYYTNKDKTDTIGIGGQFFDNDDLLYKVNIITNNTNYYSYNFKSSNTTNGYACIEKITKANRLGSELPPITFKYLSPGSNKIESIEQKILNYQIGGAPNSGLVSGDYNGDGKLDFINFNYDREKTDFKGLVYSVGTGNKFYSYNLDQNKTGKFQNIFTGNYITDHNEISDHQGIILLKQGDNNELIFEVNEINEFQLIKQREVIWDAPVQPEVGNTTWNIPGYQPTSRGRSTSIYFINSSTSLSVDKTDVTYGPKREVRLKTGFRASIRNNSTNRFSAKINFTPQDFSYNTGDFNGDGITDIIAIRRKTPNAYAEVYFVDLNPNNKSYGAKRIGWLENDIEEWHRILVGDFDGDGKSELFHYLNNNIKIYTYFNESFLLKSTIASSYFNKDNFVTLGDFNGDGKIDVLNSTNYYSPVWQFHLSNGKSYKTAEKDLGVFMNYNKSDPFGKVDYPKLNSNDRCQLGRTSVNEPCANYKSSQIIYNFIPVDFDQDGKTDLIRHLIASPRSIDSPYSYNEIAFLRNDSFNQRNEFSPRGSDINFPLATVKTKSNEGNPFQGHPIFANFDNKNLQGQYAYIQVNGQATIYKSNYKYREETCITSIENNNLITSFEYEGLEGIDATVTSAYEASFSQDYKYPYVKYARNIKGYKVVTKVTQSFDQHTSQKEFKYKGLVSSVDGSGKFGFNYLLNSNWVGTDINKIWTANTFNIKRRGILEESYTWAGGLRNQRNNQINRTIYSYNFTDSPNGVYAYLPKTIESTNRLTGVSTRTTQTYDRYYNITKSEQKYNGGSKTVTSTYFNNQNGTGTNYYIGRPKTKKETTTLGSESFSTEEAYTYSNNFIQTLKTKGNNTAWLTETFTHDRFGNITSKTLSAPGMVNRTEKSKYDTATGRFMIEATDIQGLVTKYSYDTTLGHLLEETDPFGKKQKFAYDGWNRLTKQTDYLNNTISTSYIGTADGGVQVSTTSSLGGGSKVITNRLGWEIKNSTRNVLNQWVSKEVEYDSAGKVRRESQPYFGSSPTQWTIHYYDEYNRPMQQKMYNGLIVNTAYDGLKVTVDDGTKTVSKTQDAVGNTISMTDPGGTINYTYYANNTPKETVYGTHKITTKIDGWGRKTELNDPAAGIYTYSYNILGELLSETTPNGTTTYQLDNWGRPIVKNIQGSETNMELKYEYDATHKQIKHITAKDNFNQKDYKYNYTYDNYQRLVQQYEVNPEFDFSTRYTFDNKGRLEKEYRFSNKDGSYGPNFSVSIFNHYHPQSGQLYKITGNNAQNTLWEIKQINQRGQLTQIGLGNGLTKFNDYDSYGLPKSIRASTTSQQISGFDPYNEEYYYSTRESDKKVELSLKFDAQRGNLLSRNHKSANVGAESFTYDSQDRLTDIAINGATATTQSYQPNGNIATNPQVGTYNYDPKTMYRVMGIDLNTLGKTHYEKHTPQNITYNAYKKPVSIHEQNNGRVNFEYGPLMNRSIAYYGGNSTSNAQRDYKKVYAAITPSEVIIDQKTNQRKYLTYIGGDAYTAPIAYVRQPSSMGESGFMYLHRDHLGSIIAITNSDGEVIEKTHYGAWGEVAKYWDTKGNDTLGYTSILGRGYTGHEHFNSVSLIHMNGRMYDAKLRRFLSPDNFIQDPFNTQSFNRYGYVWNNPLKYADFSGEELITILAIVGGALLGGYLGGATANGDFNPANWDWQDSSTWIGIGIGALVGAFVGYQVAIGKMTLLVTTGANTTQGFIPLANVSITKAGASIATAITGTIANIAFSSKTKREQRQENQSLDAPNSETVGSTNSEIGSSTESTNSQEDTVVDADDVVYIRQGYEINKPFNNFEFSDFLSTAGNTATLGGIIYDGLEYSIRSPWHWLDGKGNLRSTKLLEKGSNGKYLRGVQGFRNGYASAGKYASRYSLAGKAIGFVGIGITGAQYYNGDISVTEAIFDASFALVGIYGGPYGAAASLLYFGGKYFYERYTGKTLFTKPR